MSFGKFQPSLPLLQPLKAYHDLTYDYDLNFLFRNVKIEPAEKGRLNSRPTWGREPFPIIWSIENRKIAGRIQICFVEITVTYN